MPNANFQFVTSVTFRVAVLGLVDLTEPSRLGQSNPRCQSLLGDAQGGGGGSLGLAGRVERRDLREERLKSSGVE